MSSYEAAAGATWASEAASELEASGFAQVDLDYLLPEPPDLAVQAALECLQAAVTRARTTDPDLDGIVIVPLAVSGSLTYESPSVAGVLAQAWEHGPGHTVPGLYLLSPSHWRLYERVEEYRRDLGSDGLPNGYAAYYRTWRSAPTADEYDRAIYIRTVTEH